MIFTSDIPLTLIISERILQCNFIWYFLNFHYLGHLCIRKICITKSIIANTRFSTMSKQTTVTSEKLLLCDWSVQSDSDDCSIAVR